MQFVPTGRECSMRLALFDLTTGRDNYILLYIVLLQNYRNSYAVFSYEAGFNDSYEDTVRPVYIKVFGIPIFRRYGDGRKTFFRRG